MCGRMPGARHLCGGGPSAGIHQRCGVQRCSGSPAEGLGHGSNYSPQGSAADGRGAQKGLGILKIVGRRSSPPSLFLGGQNGRPTIEGMARPPRIAVWLRDDQTVTYFITLCVEERRSVLANPTAFEAIQTFCRANKNWRTIAAVAMPD